MILEIKAKHIRKGHRCIAGSCMVALAACEALGVEYASAIQFSGPDDEELIGGELIVGQWPNITTYVLSKSCAEQMTVFDRKGKKHVKPFRTRITPKND